MLSGTQGFLQKNFSLFGLVVWPAIAAYMSEVLYLIENNNKNNNKNNNNNNNNTRFTTVQIRFKFFVSLNCLFSFAK